MKNKCILITGGSGGIGSAIATAFHSIGYKCILLGRNTTQIYQVYQSINQVPEPEIDSYDISDSAEVDRFFEKMTTAGITFDVVVNCAGIEGGGKTEDISYSIWEKIIKTNLNSVFYVVKNVLSKKLINTGGAIINIASTGGKQGVVFGAPYSASKHGVVGFSKSLGLELARRKMDITVNAVCPGFVETAMAERVRNNYARLNNISPEEVKKNIENRIPLGRYIHSDEVASLCVFLASEGARGITAQAINVCGGLGNY